MTTKTDWDSFTTFLIEWYHHNKRDLPWRKSTDPYAIWLSEIMLQQTQVKTVIPYFQKFLARFPTIESLARASLQDVLKCWEGLGYYSRARHLHSTAREVKGSYGGNFPKKFDALLALPGIGLYTAAAVASIAFGEPVPVVDGNVWRVFSRILMNESSSEKGKKIVYQFLKPIIPKTDPSSFNQAMMELGALICLPQNPKCLLCPVQSYCQAYRHGKVNRFPIMLKKKALPTQQWVSVVCRSGNKVLLRQRKKTGLWGGLWEFPSMPMQKENPLIEAQTLSKKLKLPSDKFVTLEPVKHTFSHFKLTIYPFLVFFEEWRPRKNYAWGNIHTPEYPLPVPYQKLIKQLHERVLPALR